MKLPFRQQQQNAGQSDATGLDDHIGQNRVFYVREAGIVTYWYLGQRCEEECYRAERYERPLALLLIEPEPGADETAIQRHARDWLRTALRKADIAGYLGNGRYAVLLPETDHAEAVTLAARLAASVTQAQAAIAIFPKDGKNLGDLVEAAKREFGDASQPASDSLAA